MVEKENQYVKITICGIITASNFWILSNLGDFSTQAFGKVFNDALPFYKFNLFSTLIFNALIYGAHFLIEFIRNKISNRKIEPVDNTRLIPKENAIDTQNIIV